MWQRIIDADVAAAFQVWTALADQRQWIKGRIFIIGISYGQVVLMLVVDDPPVFRCKLIFRDAERVANAFIRSGYLFYRYPYRCIVWSRNCGPVVEFRNAIIPVHLEDQAGFGRIIQITCRNVPIHELIDEISFEAIGAVELASWNIEAALIV